MAIVVVILALVVFAALTAGVIAVVVGTMNKSKWGINTAVNHCPRCGTELPRIRKPANVRQAMWGGSTCPVCAAELDKWGRMLDGK